ncbi:MAG: aminotransferase class I/II-fold pyridoxal phosphate-dependent enzyme [Burkholderiales bacterium]|nr:aminotransferase class I/II-fold pyridoxal phosphate-dependent enzyme [Bacteroidia bacterium]
MGFSSKLPKVGTSIFSVMSALAREYSAINLSQGFPDFNCDPKLLELTQKYTSEGFNQYAPMQGALALREQIVILMQNCYGANYHPETEITITAGATQGIYTALAAFINKGDEVIVFEPAYDSYIPAIEVNGGTVRSIPLQYPGFTINWDLVKNVINDKTKMILINSPHNPSGATLSEKDLLTLEKLISGKNIIVISDEVYEHMVFEGQAHQSVARFKSLSGQSIIVSSFGKTIHATGWKIGYVAAPIELMSEFRKIHQFLVFSVNHPFQLALAEYLKDELIYKGLHQFYQSKRDYFRKLISPSRFVIEPCNGTYFQLLSYKKITDEKDTEFAVRLTKEKGIAAIPLSVFYTEKTQQNLLRFCFAKKEETLEIAAEIICTL